MSDDLRERTGDVLAFNRWPTNGHLIADVARLGYLDGSVLDATYGEGTFWSVWRPDDLTTNDRYKPADYPFDFTKMPFRDGRFDAVVFDPPYKLSGTPALGQFDERYGIDKPMTVKARLALIVDGAQECLRVSSRYLLVKCQDQVVSGNVVWQTTLLQQALDARLVDRFDFIYTSRPQRTQVHARRNASQLLVFKKKEALR